MLDSLGGSISKSRFICQFWCTGIQGISAHSQGGPSAKISFNNNITYYTWQIWALIVEICNCHVWQCFGGASGVLGHQGGLHLTWLYNAETVYYPNYSQIRGNSHLFLKNPKWLPNTSHNIYPMMHCWGWGTSAGRSARSDVILHLAKCTEIVIAILDYYMLVSGVLGVLRGVTSDMTVQCCLSANFGVLVFKASFLNWLGGFIGQSRFMCQVWCSSIQGIYSQFTWGPSAKVGLSANFGVLVFKASLLYSQEGSICQDQL